MTPLLIVLGLRLALLLVLWCRLAQLGPLGPFGPSLNLEGLTTLEGLMGLAEESHLGVDLLGAEDAHEGGQAPYAVYRMALASGLFQELQRVDSLGVLQRL